MILNMKIALCAVLLSVSALLRADDVEDRASELVRESNGALFLVEDKVSMGSGFVCAIGGKTFAITNQHVLAGHPGATLTLLNRKPLKMGQAAAAVGHDIMSIEVVSDAKVLELMPDVERNATIGDAVAVLGNAEGAQVIKPFVGKLVGIGPNLVEVSAEFVPGNSGSPIIHLKSGKVIGVATYVTIRAIDSLTGTKAPAIRRFGYRLDSVKQWQPVVWNNYGREFQLIQAIETRTRTLAGLLNAVRRSGAGGGSDWKNINDEVLERAIRKYRSTYSQHHGNAFKYQDGLIKSDHARALKEFTDSMRTFSKGDIEQANSQVRFDFFRRSLTDEQKVREEFLQVLHELLKPRPGE